MIRILGQSEYGLYNLSSSIISYLSLLSLGLGSSYLRFYAMNRKKEPSKIASLNGLYFSMFSVIGIIVVGAGIIISKNVDVFMNDTYTQHDRDIAPVLMLVLSINLAISFPMNVFVSYVMSQEKFIFLRLLNIVKTVFSPTISIIALFLGYGSVGLVIVSTIIAVVADIVNIIYCFVFLKMPFSFKNFDFKLVKDIFIFSLFIAINQLVDQINWQTDKILLGKMISSVAVSIYAIGSTFNNYFMQFGFAISSVFAPRVNYIVQSDDDMIIKNEKLTDLMTKVGRLQFMVLCLILLGFVFFGQTFISIWVGNDFSESYYIALLLMIPLFPDLLMNLGIEIQKAKNCHRFRSYIYLIMAIINVGISILLIKAFAIIGAAIGTAISFVLINDLLMSFYYAKRVGINIKRFWLSILKLSLFILVPSGFGVVYMLFIPKSLILMIVSILVFTLIYAISLYFFGLNSEEKNMVQNFFRKVKKEK